MTTELKIKNKHLAEEAKIIQFEENKIKSQNRKMKDSKRNDNYDIIKINEKMVNNLSHHRRWDVRNEQRSTFLAREYISGHSRNRSEKKWDAGFDCYLRNRIFNMVKKYSDHEVDIKNIDKWLKG